MFDNLSNYQCKYMKFLFNCDPVNPAKMNSGWWAYFVEGFDQSNRVPAIACKFCGNVFQHPRAKRMQGGPTSTMKSHILQACKGYTKNKEKGSGSMDKFLTGGNAIITQNNIDAQILKFFISGNIAFNQVDNHEFRKLVSMIHVNGAPAKSRSRRSLCRQLHEHAFSVENDLRQTLSLLNSKVSLALDCWSTRTMLPFLGISCNEQN